MFFLRFHAAMNKLDPRHHTCIECCTLHIKKQLCSIRIQRVCPAIAVMTAQSVLPISQQKITTILCENSPGDSIKKSSDRIFPWRNSTAPAADRMMYSNFARRVHLKSVAWRKMWNPAANVPNTPAKRYRIIRQSM